MKKTTLLVASFIMIVNVFAQQVNTAKLDSLFNLLEANHKTIGSIAISKNGKIIYTKSIGQIDEAGKMMANAETKYHIGSITKMFTASIVFNLIEEGKLSLETKLDKYFPQIPNAKNISIGNMIGHRSGIFNITNDSSYLTWCMNPITQKEMVERIAKLPSEFEANSKTEYSNSNYILLTYIIEKISKKPFADVLKMRIINKINLKNTYFGDKINNANNEAYSFSFNGDAWKKFETETDMSVPLGAGAIYSTPTDLTIFIEALFAEKIVSEKSLAQMQTIADGMGMGITRMPFYKKLSYGHTGGIDGFNSVVGYFKDDSLSFSCCNNGMNYDFNNILIGVLSCSFNKPYKLPSFSPINTSDVDFMKLIGTYATESFPLKITIATDGKSLTAQATGQSSFPLEYKGNNTFTFETAGIELKFNVEKQQMIMSQGGKSFTLTKEK
jgi:CubicO group peptidase (beta-lactamase class C family)